MRILKTTSAMSDYLVEKEGEWYLIVDGEASRIEYYTTFEDLEEIALPEELKDLIKSL